MRWLPKLGTMPVFAVGIALAVAGGRRPDRPPGAPAPAEAEGLPAGAVKRLGTGRFAAPGDIVQVAFSRDGKVLATADDRERITLWEVATGRRLRDFDLPAGDERRLRAIRFDPDGRIVCVGIKGALTVLDPADGKALDRRKLGNKRRILYGALSDDGMRVGFTTPGRPAAILDRKSGRTVATFDPPERVNPRQIALSGDGNVLAVAYPRQALHVVAVGEKPYVQEAIETTVQTSALALSHDGSLVAMAHSGGAVSVYELESGAHRLSKQIDGGGWIFGAGKLAFSPDGNVLIGVLPGGRVRVWDLEKNKALWHAMDRAAYAGEVAFDVHGNAVAIAGGNCVEVRDVRTGKLLLDVGGHRGPLRGLAFSPDGRRLVSAALDGKCLLWELQTGKPRLVIQAREPLHDVGFSPDGGQIVAAGLRTGFIAPPSITEPNMAFDVFDADRLSAFASPEMLDIMSDRMRCAAAVQFVPGSTAVRVVTAPGDLESVDCRDGNVLATENWDRGILVNSRPGVRWHESSWVSVAAGGQVMAVSVHQGRDNHVYLLHQVEGDLPYRLPGKAAIDSVLALSDDDLLLAVSCGWKVTLYELATRRPLKTLSFPGDASISTLQFSGAGAHLAAGSEDGRVAVWMLRDLGKPMVRGGHSGSVESLAFSRDGRVLASGGRDTQVFLWDVSAEARPADANGADDARLAAGWKALGNQDPAEAHAALWRLVAAGDRAAGFLAERLDVAAGVDANRVARLIARLDGETYAERTAAQKALIQLGPAVEPFARRALKNSGSPEQRSRLAAVLDAFRPSGALKGEALRRRRAVAALERVGGRQAEKALAHLAGGAKGAAITVDAAAALWRLRLRRPAQRDPR
jgi:WD40 repeat protein